MNPTTEQPPQPPQPNRPSFSCERHPEEHFTGFCPSCLCERLTTLDQSSASSSRRPSNSSVTTSTAAAALRAIFKVPSTFTAAETTNNKNKTKTKPSFFPELRRTQSFSALRNERFSGAFEPQRKSCDVRVRNTLWTLFSLDEENKSSQNHHSITVESGNLGDAGPVLESKEEDEHDDDEEIRVSEETNTTTTVEETVGEIVEEDTITKTMKDHIDLDSQAKKPAGMDLKGSFRSAASVFSKKWHKWRRKQKPKQRSTGGDSAALAVEKTISRQYRQTQSEVGDYGFGRRSCDTDPRFSLDAGRISFDDPRYSFEEPRASWDGYLIGRTFPRLPPMVSVVEEAPVHVLRSDSQIPVEEPTNCINGDETIPGGSAQTKEYYADSSSKRRKSLDRSSSLRKSVMSEIDEMKAVSNAKVTPATIDYIHGAKLLSENRYLRDLNSKSLRANCAETFETGFRDNASVIENGEQKGLTKSRRWSWNIWGFIHRRGGGNNDERYSRGNGVERSFSESWQELSGEGNGEEAGGGFHPKVFRSNSSVSWRNSYSIGQCQSFGSARKSSVEITGNGKKRGDAIVFGRNQSVR